MGRRGNIREADLYVYALVAVTAIFLAWWGVREGSKALVNYGIAVFALTVDVVLLLEHYGQAGALAWVKIMLGILFLTGGWLLEKMRRKLVGSIPEVAA